MIVFDHVSKVYSPTSTAVEDVTFRIESKEFISIVGHSGAGKSTLLKLLLAEDTPSEGKVFFEDVDVHAIPKADLAVLRRKIGTVFQDFKLLPSKTAFENVAFAMEAAGATDEDIETDVPQVLELVGLIDKAHHFPHELSGGEKQRVSIARAIVNRPDVIIADEPTGNLDPVNTYEIIELLKKINSFDTTVIVATHNKDIVNGLERRVITLEGGKITRDAKKGKYIL
ncbi:MAG: cell division ATP-binding protein FtsE [bacterium]|nr:cell division ATP-binding protein FtsE [bacterium]